MWHKCDTIRVVDAKKTQHWNISSIVKGDATIKRPSRRLSLFKQKMLFLRLGSWWGEHKNKELWVEMNICYIYRMQIRNSELWLVDQYMKWNLNSCQFITLACYFMYSSFLHIHLIFMYCVMGGDKNKHSNCICIMYVFFQIKCEHSGCNCKAA